MNADYNGLILCDNPATVAQVYGDSGVAALKERCRLYPQVLSAADLVSHQPELTQVEVIFSTWGMPCLTPEQLAALPALKALFYAAGSIRAFAPPLFERGVAIFSAWSANAIPVAEFTIAQVTLAMKGYFRNIRDCRNPQLRRANRCFVGPGNYGGVVSLLGAGQIGRLVIQGLQKLNLQVQVYDPYLSAEAAAALGVRKVELLEAFSTATVVSNHIPDLPETRGMLTRQCFEAMAPNSVFINTGRGATVDEAGMIALLQERQDLTALLDVTFPEPPEEDSPLYTLPNVFLTSHIAGSLNQETRRMAHLMIEEYDRWRSGEELRCQVTPEMMQRMA